MDNQVMVYVDDAAHAQQVLAPLLARGAAETRWVLVACAPRMTHRISKWVSHSARESWRAKWADKLFAQLLPWLESGNGQVSTVLAKTPLPELLEQLQQHYGAQTPLLDARRPKQESANTQQAYVPNPAVATAAPAPTVKVKKPGRTWALPGTLAGLFCMMFVAVE